MQSLFAALAAAALSSPPTDLPPLQGDWIEVLYGPKGERVGSLVVPLGARDPRPLVVAVHGASGHSTWMCGATHDIVGPHPFVVCPHPDAALEAMESWTDVTQLRRAVDRAVTAATNKYAAYIQKEDALYIGHSQGAMWASAMLALPGSMKFPNVIFYEGIPSNLGAASHQLANAGVRRVLVVSGQSGWAQGHREFAKVLGHRGIAANHVHVESGHFFNGASISLMRRNLWWLLGESKTWQGDAATMTTAWP